MGSGIFREKKWKCSCGAFNKGRYNNCQSCGKGRQEGTTFQQAGGPIVTSPELLTQADSGQDWHCDHCGSGNDDLKANGTKLLQCLNCGQARDKGDTNHFAAVAKAAAKNTRRKALGPNGSRRRKVAQTIQTAAQRSKPQSKSGQWLLGFGLLVGFVLLVYGIWWLLFDTKPLPAQIAHYSWERSVQIEREELKAGSGWTLPAGVTQMGAEERQNGTNTVTVGSRPSTTICSWEDKGNGFEEAVMCPDIAITKEVPNMQTWYTYQWTEFVYHRTETASGVNREPYDPSYQLSAWHNEQLGIRSARYVIHFLDQNQQTWETAVAFRRWQQLPETANVFLNVNRAGQMVSFELQ